MSISFWVPLAGYEMFSYREVSRGCSAIATGDRGIQGTGRSTELQLPVPQKRDLVVDRGVSHHTFILAVVAELSELGDVDCRVEEIARRFCVVGIS